MYTLFELKYKMSIEHYSAENRNSNINGNINRNSNINNVAPTNRISRIRQIARCCSFCRQTGHNITNCQDNRLTTFEELCISQKNLFQLEENYIARFKDWLCSYYLNDSLIVKSFAIRKCGATTRTPVNGIIQIILNYIYNIYDTNSGESQDYIPLSSEELYVDRLRTGILGLLMIQNNNRNDLLQNIITNYILYGILPDKIFNIEYKIEPNSDVNKNVLNKQMCDCNICYESVENVNFVKFNCNHEFCKICVKNILKNCNEYTIPTCAFCRAEIKEITTKTEQVKEYISNNLYDE